MSNISRTLRGALLTLTMASAGLMATAEQAAAQSATAEGKVSMSTETGVDTSMSGESQEPYMQRYKPSDNMVELGLYAGAIFPSDYASLRDQTLTNGRDEWEFKDAAPDFGFRAAFLPLAFVGFEGELGFAPTYVVDPNNVEPDSQATLMMVRAHILGQLPNWSVTPFVVVGYGEVQSYTGPLGNDSDPGFEFGGGVKVPFSEYVMGRFDVRDTVTNQRGNRAFPHHPELLLGITASLNRTHEPPPVADTDRDGFLDPDDKCPTEPGVAPDGCPIRDTDGDGFMDPQDKCPTEAGVAPDGCPVADTDGDGFLDPDDKCPKDPGVAPDGCPDPDPDGDGIIGEHDKCPNEPENRNGFEDGDGCPDEIPEDVKKFTGVIAGVEFDFGKATIRKNSEAILDEAVKVLQAHPSIRVMISGHTDNVGSAERNLELSQQRADSVRTYLVSHGIEGSRVQAEGMGFNQPIATNDTREGRQRNRRIEFTILTQ